MLIEEAEWIGKELEKLINSGAIKNVLNVGSSTADSWTDNQKHIREYILSPLEKSNIKVTNTDLKEGDGVDFAGDLNDEAFVAKLVEKKFDLVLCANLLEHVEQPFRIAAHITQLLHNDSIAIITVPHVYPYHPDPADYLFRPDINELKELFTRLTLVSSALVEGRRSVWRKDKMKTCSNYMQVLINDPRLLILTVLRLLTPFYKYRNWKKTAFYLPYFFKHFSVTCLVLVKHENQ
jgi:SAM-dependent methyltransferase